jgi:hypothetical protein
MPCEFLANHLDLFLSEQADDPDSRHRFQSLLGDDVGDARRRLLKLLRDLPHGQNGCLHALLLKNLSPCRQPFTKKQA